jgi:hypothetical protein
MSDPYDLLARSFPFDCRFSAEANFSFKVPGSKFKVLWESFEQFERFERLERFEQVPSD